MELIEIKGVGSKMVEKLNKHGIFSVFDLLNYYPYTFQVYDLGLVDNKGTIQGIIVSKPVIRFIRKGLNSIFFKVESSGNIYNVTIFNRAFMKEHLRIGREVFITGTRKNNKFTASELTFQYEHIKPVYKLNDIAPKTFRNLIAKVISLRENVEETLPAHFIDKYKLLSKSELIRLAHNPRRVEDIKQFFRRSKYEEFFLYQLEVKSIKRSRKSEGISIKINRDYLASMVKALPFELTSSQKKCLDECIFDLEKEDSMNRLVQGDVGSGKTVVALLLMQLVINDGYQAALMAPTEILAEQHYKTVKKMFPSLRCELLTSSLKSKEALSRIDRHEVDLIIGTHALFQQDVYYSNLGIVVTDEQHRFGVDQRKAIERKGIKPNILSLSATPIPRTLAITLFGDMDISTIMEKPVGRQEIKSKVIDFSKVKNIVSFVQERIDAGEQVYIVTSLIEESEALKAVDLDKVNRWVKNVFNAKVASLHGRMKSEEKESVMSSFKNKEIDVLLSTTVIEVGVDVPNATVMIIFNAERFGLSQLHQLRGRIGRGNQDSYCFFVHNTDNELSLERLKTIEGTTDGFKIAEADLKLRGPGDFLGSRQSGFPKFNFGNVFEDFKILEVAATDADYVVYNINDEKFILCKKYLETLN